MTESPRLCLAALLAVAALVGGLLSGCEASRSVAAVLVADTTAEQWADVDLPALQDRVTQRCEGCELRIESAGGDAEVQAEQLDAVLEDGADVVVLAPVDPASGEELVARAGDVPVIAWRTLVPGADRFVGTDPGVVARLLARAVARTAPSGRARPRVLALRPAGSAAGMLDATRRELSAARVDEVDVGGDGAAAAVRGARPAAYDVVLAPSDVLAADAAGALDGRDRPALVGPGASLETARRLVAGDQTATVHEPLAAMADHVGDLVVAELTATDAPDPTGELEGVDAWLAEPRTVTLATLTEVMVRDGSVALDDLCRGATLRRCRRLGMV